MMRLVGVGVADPLNRSPWSTMTIRIFPRGVDPYLRCRSAYAVSAWVAVRAAYTSNPGSKVRMKCGDSNVRYLACGTPNCALASAAARTIRHETSAARALTQTDRSAC